MTLSDVLSMQRRIVAAYSAALKPLRLSPSQAAILNSLYSLRTATLPQLVALANVSVGAISREVTALEKRGLVRTHYRVLDGRTRGKTRVVTLCDGAASIETRLKVALEEADRVTSEILTGK
jgi:DNA-binding MarR family transcriptional regulator